MISILSCENTCPHGGLRSPWIPWDMGQGHMGLMGRTQARAQAAAAGSLARSRGLGPGLGLAHGAHVPLPWVHVPRDQRTP